MSRSFLIIISEEMYEQTSLNTCLGHVCLAKIQISLSFAVLSESSLAGADPG